MKRIIFILTCSIAAAVAADAFARGGGGHGGGGHGGGGFGGGGRSFGGGGFGGGGRSFSGGFGGHSPSFGGGYGGFSRSYGSYARPSYTGGMSNFSRSNFGANSFNRGSFSGSNFANRSNFNSGNFNAGNRVSGIRGSGVTGFNRSNLGNNFGVGNRNNFGIGTRNGINNGNIGNRTANINNWNRNGNINNWTNNRAGWNNNINHWANRGNRPWSHPYYNHYNNWHGWHNGYWNYWGAGYYPWAWFGLGALGGWGWGSPGYVYSNPYYVTPVYDGSYYPDYSQPIPPPTDAEVDSPPPSGLSSTEPTPDDSTQTDPKVAAAMAVFDEGRKLFKTGDYAGAIEKVDVALKDLPSDVALHEFRALCLFAQGHYKEAAAGVYAVLAAGPGWDWNTVKSLYPDTATYTMQLRALEAYKKANPNAPDASFLLAYQYLVLGYPDQAVGELKQVVKLQPNDKLSAALLQALEQRNQPQQQPAPAPEQGQ